MTKWINIKNIIKQIFCSHSGTKTTTESSFKNDMFIVKTLIQCSNCHKTFPQHPNADCCYVKHIHNQLIYDFFINKLKNMQQAKQ